MTSTGIPPTASSEAVATTRKGILFAALALLLAAAFAGRQISSWPARLRYPGEQNFVEGMRLAEMQHLRQGIPIYAPASAERFDASIYGPVYYLVGSRLVDPQRPAYLPLRVVSTLGTLGCAVGCGLLAYWLSRSYLAAALAPAVFLSYGIVTFHGTSARCDTVAVLLAFWGFLIAWRFRQGGVGILLSVPFMLAGFFYKQQYVAAPLGVLVFLLLEKRYRLAAEFLAVLSFGGLALLALFQSVVFSGQDFFRHFVTYNLLPYSWDIFRAAMMLMVVLILIPLLMSLDFLRLYPDKLLGCFLSCAFLVGFLGMGKEGSDSNYFLETLLILSSLVAALVAMRSAEPGYGSELSILMVIALFFAQWFVPQAPGREDSARDQALQDYLRREFVPGTRAFGYYTGDLVRAGLDAPISDTYQYVRLVRSGILSEQDLTSQLHAGRFGVVVLTFDLLATKGSRRSSYYLTPAWEHALMANYRVAASLEMPRPEKFDEEDRVYLWVPRRSPQ